MTSIPKLEDMVHNTMSDEDYNTNMIELKKEKRKQKNGTKQIMPNGAVIYHPDGYKGEEHDKLAYQAMADDNGTISSVCVALRCTKPTLHSWMKRHKNLAEAVQKGRQIGEELFRQKIRGYAFEPQGSVNNGLIKMIAKNVHGIDADETQTIVINNANAIIDAPEETSRKFAEALEKDIQE